MIDIKLSWVLMFIGLILITITLVNLYGCVGMGIAGILFMFFALISTGGIQFG